MKYIDVNKLEQNLKVQLRMARCRLRKLVKEYYYTNNRKLLDDIRECLDFINDKCDILDELPF